MQVRTLKPGFMVYLHTTINGNVNYDRETIEAEHYVGNGSKRSVINTTKTIADAKEHEMAQVVRSAARSAIVSVCSTVPNFGLMCPDSKKTELDEAIEKAQLLARAFNTTASITRVGVYVMVGYIAQDDVQAVKAINNEVRELMTEMEEGLKNLDVERVRAAATKARSVGTMLSDESRERIQSAIAVARQAATKIVKAGEEGGLAIDQATLLNIRQARTAFLDMDDQAEIGEVTATGRGVDLIPEGAQNTGEGSEDTTEAPKPKAPEIDIEEKAEEPVTPATRRRARVAEMADD